MGRQILSRLGQFILVIFAVTFFSFSLVYLAPGDAAELVLSLQGEGASHEVIEEMREEMGLNDPFWVQYGRWLGNALRGDLGVSYKNGHTVASEISGKFHHTILLASAAFAVLLLFAFPLGIISALCHNKLADKIIRVITIFGVSMPQFWLALMLIFVLAVMPIAALAFQLRILNDGKAVLNTYSVRELAQGAGRAEEIPVFSGAVQRGRIEIDMTMGMGPVGMGNDEKGVFALGPAHSQLIGDF